MFLCFTLHKAKPDKVINRWSTRKAASLSVQFFQFYASCYILYILANILKFNWLSWQQLNCIHSHSKRKASSLSEKEVKSCWYKLQFLPADSNELCCRLLQVKTWEINKVHWNGSEMSCNSTSGKTGLTFETAILFLFSVWHCSGRQGNLAISFHVIWRYTFIGKFALYTKAQKETLTFLN